MPEYILPDDEEEVELIPDGAILAAELIEVKEKIDEKFRDRDTDEPVVQLLFKFAITDEGPYLGNYLFGKVRVFWGNKVSKQLKQWASDILNQPLPGKWKLNTDVLHGQHCRIVIGVESWPDKKDENPDPTQRRMFHKNVVTDVMPTRDAVGGLAAPDEDEEPF